MFGYSGEEMMSQPLGILLLRALAGMEDKLPAQLARVVLLAPRRIVPYLRYSIVAVEDPTTTTPSTWRESAAGCNASSFAAWINSLGTTESSSRNG